MPKDVVIHSYHSLVAFQPPVMDPMHSSISVVWDMPVPPTMLHLTADGYFLVLGFKSNLILYLLHTCAVSAAITASVTS